MLSSLALRGDGYEYSVAGGGKAHLWPGSGVFQQKPKWLVAAEVVETTRRYLRTCGQIDPRWIERIAGHLVKRTYHGVHWAPAHASAMALERVTLFGLTIVAGRRIHYGPIDPAMSRHLMIEQGLVEGHIEPKPAFLVQNEELVEELERLQAKLRRRDLLVPDFSRYEFYDRRVPADVYDGATLTKWLRDQSARLDDDQVRPAARRDRRARRGAFPRHVERPAPGTAAGLPVRAGFAAGRRDAQRAHRGPEPGRSRTAGLAGARPARGKGAGADPLAAEVAADAVRARPRDRETASCRCSASARATSARRWRRP